MEVGVDVGVFVGTGVQASGPKLSDKSSDLFNRPGLDARVAAARAFRGVSLRMGAVVKGLGV